MKAKGELDILIIPGIVPYPPNEGGKLCTFGLIDYLRKLHKIQILLTLNYVEERAFAQELVNVWPDVTIHIVDIVRNELPNKTVKNTIVNNLKKAYHVIKPNNDRKVEKDVYSEYTINMTVPFFPHHHLFIKELNQILADNKFDIIQTEYIRMLNLVNDLPDDSKKIFVQIESRSDILYDYGTSNKLDFNYVNHVANNTRFLEYSYMKSYNAILALNKTDQIQLQQSIPSAVSIYNSPYGILDKDIQPLSNEAFVAENLIFMGSEFHPPNLDALDWFLTDVLPYFAPLPFKRIYVTGKWSAETSNKYKKITDRINFIGFVDDLAPYLKNSVSIVPIRLGGGGIRTKILSSMVAGSPVVSTSLAAVGISGDNKKEFLIADTAVEFAEAVSKYFTDNKLAQTIIKNAYQLILDKYSQSHVGDLRNSIYKQIASRV